MGWEPARYLEFEDARLRPALDLLARIPAESARSIVDLGCGAGNVALWLSRRWPEASIEGVDGDEAMLAKARTLAAGDTRFRWTRADLAQWRATSPPDVLYSNAALHWLDEHPTLFPRLLEGVGPGGWFAVQMPYNFGATAHAELFATARESRWRDRLAARIREAPVASPESYFDWLSPRAQSVDIWTTEYLHRLARRSDGEHPIVAWMRGTSLLPFVGAFDAREREAFVGDYAARIERAYTRRPDGSVLFPFRRLFIVAQR